MPLQIKQQRFVVEYLRDLNVTRAYIRAGYSARNANRNALRVMKSPQIRNAIEARQRELATQFEVSPERVVAEFAKLAFANMDDFIEADPNGDVRLELWKVDRARRAAFSEIVVDEFQDGTKAPRARRVRIKLASKQQALDSLARHLGMFIDRTEVSLTENLAEGLAAARKRAWG